MIRKKRNQKETPTPFFFFFFFFCRIDFAKENNCLQHDSVGIIYKKIFKNENKKIK